MFASFYMSVVAATTVAHAHFTFNIVKPIDQEYLQLGGTFPVELRTPVRRTLLGVYSSSLLICLTVLQNVVPCIHELNIQLSLCTEITGLPLCDNSTGTVLLTAPFHPPDQTYNITIPANQPPGLTRLVAGHIITTPNVSGAYHLREAMP